ncbi:MAG: prepilin-type N-terminal cleavage/methylation domain-containing protein [Candidatus Omnitrophota bacterium]|nr:prepilin-type N-terminal cleavage/methylation domain-containing protein [Candidatus Omnitrophota bacterium]
MSNLLRKKTGFSLVEVIVALIVLGLAASGMMAPFIMGRENVNLASRRIDALNLAIERIEDLKGKVGIPGITPGRIAPDELAAGAHGPNPVGGDLAAFGGQRKYTIQDNIAGTNLKQVTLTVTWNEPQ